jgi:hypothetical protein
MRLLATGTLGQGIDAISQCRQRLVDLLGLLQRLSRRSCLADLLASGKIGKIQLALFGAAIREALQQLEDEQAEAVGQRTNSSTRLYYGWLLLLRSDDQQHTCDYAN